MSLVLIDGFDLYPALAGDAGMNVVWTFNSTSSMGLDPGRFGGQAIRSSQDRFIILPVFALTANVSVGFAFKASGFPSGSEEICRLMSASGDQVILGRQRQPPADRLPRQHLDGARHLDRDPEYGHLALPGGRGCDRRRQRDRHGLAGRGQGHRSQRRGHEAADRGRGRSDQVPAQRAESVHHPDDRRRLRDQTSTRLGESRVTVLYPSADTADADWIPSTGTDHYATVDETTVNGDTDYVSSGTVGDLDLYEVSDLGVTPDSIHAVQVTMCARKDDAATREVRSKVKSGAATANGAPHALTANYVYYRDIHEADPNTSAAWTLGGLNSLQIGPEVVT